MTEKELRQYRSLKKEIADLQARLHNCKVQDAVTGSDSDFPYTQRKIEIEGMANTEAAKLLQTQLTQCRQQFQCLQEFIAGIDDSEIRQIFRHRYIDGLSWQQVAFTIGYQDESVPRKKHNRFLK